MFRRKKKKSGEVAIQLTALVDALTILLVFFMMSKVAGSNIKIFDSSVFPTSEKQAQADGANEAPITYLEITDVNKIKVTVKSADKNVFESVTALDQLNLMLKNLKLKYPLMKSLKIESSPEVSYKDVIKVFDMAKAPESVQGNESTSPSTDKPTLFEDVTLEDIFKG